MTDHRIPDQDAADRAIDRAVREIMSVEPMAGFRQRVLRRLAEPQRTRSTWAGLTLAGATAVAATALILTFLVRPTERANDAPPVAAAPSRALPHVLPGTEPNRSAPLSQPSQRRVQGPQTAAELRVVHAASLPTGDEAEGAVPIEPIETASSLAQSTSQSGLVQPIPAMSAIVVETISISDIAITPIRVGGR
jgi:hypothetical protein